MAEKKNLRRKKTTQITRYTINDSANTIQKELGIVSWDLLVSNTLWQKQRITVCKVQLARFYTAMNRGVRHMQTAHLQSACVAHMQTASVLGACQQSVCNTIRQGCLCICASRLVTVSRNDSCSYDARDDLSITSRENNGTEKLGYVNLTKIIFRHWTLVSREVRKA